MQSSSSAYRDFSHLETFTQRFCERHTIQLNHLHNRTATSNDIILYFYEQETYIYCTVGNKGHHFIRQSRQCHFRENWLQRAIFFCNTFIYLMLRMHNRKLTVSFEPIGLQQHFPPMIAVHLDKNNTPFRPLHYARCEFFISQEFPI